MQKRNDDLVQLLTPDFIRRNEIMGAWTNYTPVVTSSIGAFVDVKLVGRYKVIGRLCFVNVKIAIEDAGTAAGTLYATLPRTASASSLLSVGTAYRVGSGFSTVAPSGTSMSILLYDGTTIIANGTVYASSVYEI